ncbi:hypothetical protein SAMN04488550_3275 [Gordonia malaquae]|uniref:DUF7489 domain-containing protein n=1 Tax=Gordonia malaquae NBRC 108250 TaxID=1223542 RepID=M3UFD7_GORML|nr:hypothetical protein [Gordonia malaquae]GAC77885.1 hypothetical protein GM1_001_00080 [Gordonia malaquae NBRC 108250]SED83272.1 hypothetical protein SAMN04488550_3275 [Gordonia malaquae]
MAAEAWRGTVAAKRRALLDGSSLYRRLTVDLDGGGRLKVRVPRELWDSLEVGDVVVKSAGHDPVKG